MKQALLAILGTLGAGAWAETLSLEALSADAVANNPEIAFYEAEIAAAKGARRSAGQWQNPEAVAELGAKRTVGDGLDASGVVWAASVQQTFEWPGRVSLRKAIANRDITLAELGLEQFQAALSAAVRQQAFALLAAQKKQQAAAHVAARGEELMATLVQREPAGITPLLESRAIEASILALKREEVEATKQATTARLALNQLRGRLLAEPVTIADEKLTFPKLPPVADLIKKAATENFDLRQREVELEQQGFRVDLATNEAWPSLTAGPIVEQEFAGDQETRAAMAVSVPLPIWNRNEGVIDTARARKIQATSALIVEQRAVERRIRELAESYELHRREIARWQPGFDSKLREAADAADRHYRLGAVPLATYLEIQKSYLEALDAIYATKADALQALAELELLTGSRLQ